MTQIDELQNEVIAPQEQVYEESHCSNGDVQTKLKNVIEELQMEETGPYFKLANPMFLQELDWGITLSKYEFPWQDIAKGSGFSARECYEKYISVVRDPHAFLKKVLNSSQPNLKEKYTKLMQNQMN